MQAIVYTSPTCSNCGPVISLLESKGVSVTKRDIADPSIAQELIDKTGQTSVPVTIIDGEVVIGFMKKRLERLAGGE